MTKVRPFNKEAYDGMDKPSKLALKEMMEAKGYLLVGDIDEESYKKWDLQFIKDGTVVSFETEMRRPFSAIKNNFKTIHIPIRKANNQSDWYIIWNLECSEFAMIETSKIREYATKNTIEINCNEGTDWNYTEDFINIPKDDWTFHEKNESGKWVKVDVITENITEEMANNMVRELLSKNKSK
jgi:hypothetical protein